MTPCELRAALLKLCSDLIEEGTRERAKSPSDPYNSFWHGREDVAKRVRELCQRTLIREGITTSNCASLDLRKERP